MEVHLFHEITQSFLFAGRFWPEGFWIEARCLFYGTAHSGSSARGGIPASLRTTLSDLKISSMDVREVAGVPRGMCDPAANPALQ